MVNDQIYQQNWAQVIQSYLDDMVGGFVSSCSLQFQSRCMFTCFISLHSNGLNNKTLTITP